jgi:hypothetical protein
MWHYYESELWYRNSKTERPSANYPLPNFGTFSVPFIYRYQMTTFISNNTVFSTMY